MSATIHSKPFTAVSLNSTALMVFAKIRSLHSTILTILALGLALRLCVVLLHQRPLISDERDYHRLAVNMIEEGTYGFGETPTAYRPFGYPAIISLIYLIADQTPLVVKFLQALIDTCTAFLLTLLVGQKALRTQIFAAGLWSLYLPAVLYLNLLLSETVFTFFLVLTAVVIHQTAVERSRHALLIGLLLGWLTLMKPGMLLVVLLLPGFFYTQNIPLRHYRFAVLGTLIVLLPWIGRNYLALGKPTIGTNGGINLLIGNNPNTTGAYGINYPEDALANAQSEGEADRLAYSFALRYIGEFPQRFILNGIKKLAHLFSSEGGLLVWSFHQNPEDASERYAVKYSSLPLLLSLIINVSYIAVLLAGILGMFLELNDSRKSFFLLLLITWILTHFVFFGGSRFHFPLMPFFALYAAHLYSKLPLQLHALPLRTRWGFSIIAIGLSAIWVTEIMVVFYAV